MSKEFIQGYCIRVTIVATVWMMIQFGRALA
jgi:hypothetical protein